MKTKTKAPSAKGLKLIVYSTPSCVFCKPFERGPLRAFQTAHPLFTVIHVDLSKHDLFKDEIRLFERLGLMGVPSSVFVGPRGGLRFAVEGAATFEELQKAWRIATGRPARKEKR